MNRVLSNEKCIDNVNGDVNGVGIILAMLMALISFSLVFSCKGW